MYCIDKKHGFDKALHTASHDDAPKYHPLTIMFKIDTSTDHSRIPEIIESMDLGVIKDITVTKTKNKYVVTVQYSSFTATEMFDQIKDGNVLLLPLFPLSSPSSARSSMAEVSMVGGKPKRKSKRKSRKIDNKIRR